MCKSGLKNKKGVTALTQIPWYSCAQSLKFLFIYTFYSFCADFFFTMQKNRRNKKGNSSQNNVIYWS